MKIAAIADKIGRVQHSRMLLLQDILKDIDIDVYVTDDKPKLKSYDLVYYTHFNLLKKVPYKGKKYASITSHKCLDDLKNTVHYLKQFDAISVNNNILYSAFKNKISNLFFTPNGVDSRFFSFSSKSLTRPFVFGWVGNRDRATKNYESIVIPLSKHINIKKVAPSKKDSIDSLLTKEQMREFYHSLDFFLVTSSTEGTPNPGLEAMSCGLPVISTKVGNMAEIIEDSINGFYVEPTLESFRKKIEYLSNISDSTYENVRRNTRKCIEKHWDWSYVSNYWRQFFLY